MTINKEELKKKIIYRSKYRGSKEMDVLMSSFVKSVISNLETNDLIKLHELVNLDDETLNRFKSLSLDDQVALKNNIINKFIKFKS
tara:strand:- start:902 stop:1159 length:258 start_codon:yes stop_codon:yes gene_type:complete